MKLGEALNERARLSKRVSELRDTLDSSLITNEGEDPVADPQKSLDDALNIISEISELVARINKTNSVTTLADGSTITEALAERDALSAEVAMFEFVMRKLTGGGDPYSFRVAGDVKRIRHLDLASVTSRRDVSAGERRHLDAELQALNMITDLVE